MEHAPEPALDLPARRRVVFVVGSARTGLSALAEMLRALGMHEPEPEWVGGLLEELLGRCLVDPADARPSAWFETSRLGGYDPLRTRVATWLEEQLSAPDAATELVVADSRLAWFQGLWRSAAMRCDATPSYVMMLRPVTDVVGSGLRAHGAQPGSPGAVQRTAAWVNVMLHTERGTRGSVRAPVRYTDLLADWTVPVAGLGAALDLASVQNAHANDVRAVHAVVDAGTRAPVTTWDELAVPARLRELAVETEVHLDRLAEPEGDSPGNHDALDQLRGAYAELYGEAETLAQSTAAAAYREGLTAAAEGGGGPFAPADVDDRAARGARADRPVRPAPDDRTDRSRRGVDRVPHGVRAMVPESTRRSLRRALGRERP